MVNETIITLRKNLLNFYCRKWLNLEMLEIQFSLKRRTWQNWKNYKKKKCLISIAYSTINMYQSIQYSKRWRDSRHTYNFWYLYAFTFILISYSYYSYSQFEVLIILIFILNNTNWCCAWCSFLLYSTLTRITK